MYTRDVIGKEVLGAEGWKIGKVEEIVIDKESWAVTALSVALESNIAKEFNVKKMWGKSAFTVPIGQVQGVADRIILKISKSQISDLAKASAQEPAKPGQE